MQKPNILFLLSDEHSFRFVGHRSSADGGEDVATPALDRLAAQSTVFTDTYCGAPICVPSRISLMTGLTAEKSGACDNTSYLDPALDTMPKALSRAEYTTCLIGKMHFLGSNQFHGFQYRPYGDLCGNHTHQFEHLIPMRPGDPVIGDDLGQQADLGSDRLGDFLETRTTTVGETKIPESQCGDQIVATETVSFLREHASRAPEKPWFLCASFSRPHYPLNTPARFLRNYPVDKITEPFVGPEGDSFDHVVTAALRAGFKIPRISKEEEMRARAAYFANVEFFDQVLGDLLLRLEMSGLLENTIIVYASDHGECAGEHGAWWKSGWYEASTRVPMMISTPEQRAGTQRARNVETPVSLLDLMPTFAAISGAEIGDVSGRNLLPAIGGQADLEDRMIICDHLNERWGEGSAFRMVRFNQYKLVVFDNEENLFFDLESDPKEQHNLFAVASGDEAEILDKMLDFVRNGLDFRKVLDEQRARMARLRAAYPMMNENYNPNQYMLSSGRVIEAEQALYYQSVITDDPDSFFGDYPDHLPSPLRP
ncbi:sulfatase-like hydrolase/transferase [Hoeflea poritis]|uniref:Sulfatase-like hydrolase/transferase n=1 Tax=Hoeflea poritis TaxID=2993659 RepID=A0ABT4VVI9_9HYPH|nr:sulfatase-like hydrolase/transferase [Hoeflea poritis]MDA4848711.1 sulfatase-like hydrolase/transferase [Hoeflea poritis]